MRGLDGFPAASRPRLGRQQFELIEDWDGSKRQRRISRLQHEQQTQQDADLTFQPAVNAVSKELAADAALRHKRSRPRSPQHSTPIPTTSSSPAPTAFPSSDSLQKRERIRLFLQRTAERQQRKVAAKPNPSPLPSFTPQLTPPPHSVSRPGEPVTASERKRRRKCEEIFHVYATSGGYIPRHRWLSLVKKFTRTIDDAQGRGLKADMTLDDVSVIQMVVKECDREVRRLRAVRVALGESVEEDDLSWRLSLDDFMAWFERMWSVLMDRARQAEDSDQRVQHMQHMQLAAQHSR